MSDEKADSFDITFQLASNALIRTDYQVHKDETVKMRVGFYLQEHFEHSQEQDLVVTFRANILFAKGTFKDFRFRNINGFGSGSVLYVFSTTTPASERENGFRFQIQSQQAHKNISYGPVSTEDDISKFIQHFADIQRNMSPMRIVFQFNCEVIAFQSYDQIYKCKDIAGLKNNCVIYAFEIWTIELINIYGVHKWYQLLFNVGYLVIYRCIGVIVQLYLLNIGRTWTVSL